MKRISILALLLAAMLAAEGARAEIVLRGFLTSGGEKVVGASVRLAAAPDDAERFEMAFAHPALTEVASGRSGPGGYFELVAPEQGFYQLQVAAEGYLGTERWLPLLRAAPDPVALELIRSRPVTLKVMDPEGLPVEGVRVRLGFQRDGAGRYPTWPLFRATAADGTVLLQVPQGQDAAAVLAASGFVSAATALPAGEALVAARLERGSPVEVEVADPRRRFLPGVVIFAPDTLHEIGRTGRDGKARVRVAAGQASLGFTDADGRYAIEPLSAEPPASADGGEPAPPKLKVVLEDPQPIEGRVFELPERVPLAGAWISLGGEPPRFTRSDRLGFFRLIRLPGRRGLFAAKEGYVPSFAGLDRLPLPLDLGLEKAATLFGRVTDGSGAPVAGAFVTATSEEEMRSLRSGGRSRVITDREGNYTLAELPADEPAQIVAIFEKLQAKLRIEPVAAGESRRADLRLPRRQS